MAFQHIGQRMSHTSCHVAIYQAFQKQKNQLLTMLNEYNWTHNVCTIYQTLNLSENLCQMYRTICHQRTELANDFIEHVHVPFHKSKIAVASTQTYICPDPKVPEQDTLLAQLVHDNLLT